MPPKGVRGCTGSTRVAMTKKTGRGKKKKKQQPITDDDDSSPERPAAVSSSDSAPGSPARAAHTPPRGPTPPVDDLQRVASDGSHVENSQPPKKKARKTSKKGEKTPKLILSDHSEIDISDWLKSNQFIYTKGSREFRETQLKIRAWEEKAKELNVEPAALQTWYESIRTKVGKLTKDKSGQAAPQLTDREKFIIMHFRFLKDHIVRQPSRVAVSVSILKKQ